MWLNVIREFEESFRRKPCCLIFFFYGNCRGYWEGSYGGRRNSPLLWLCASCLNLFFMVLSFLPFVSWHWRFSWCWRELCAVYRFNPRLQKLAINQVNYLSPWINISSDKLKTHFSGVRCTLSHKMVIVLTVIALACSEASVSCLIASI